MAARIELPGALAVVTGAGRGIGRATALALAGRGCRVAAVDVDGASAEKTAVACAEAGTPAVAYAADVSDREAVDALAGRVHDEHGPAGVLVANAGVGMTGHFLDAGPGDWAWIRGVNLDGVVHTCRAFGRPMVDAGRGHAVVVSSALGYTPRSTESLYAATKAGVLTLALSLRGDWRRHGVGVSAVCPGIIDTPIIDDTRFLGEQAGRRDRIVKVFRRGHPPEKVAAAIVDAVERDRAVVPVGWEARLGWWFHRFAPLSFQSFLARQETK